jgi:small subunit ribosomal protein S20
MHGAFTFSLSSVIMASLITFIRVSVKEISLIKKIMPITQSAKKALRGSLKKKAVNDRSKKLVKESIKNIEKLVKEKKKNEAKKLLSLAYSTIDKAAKKGVFKKNNASRKKARLSKITK